MKTTTYGTMNRLTKIHRWFTTNKIWYRAYTPIIDDWNEEC